MLADISGELALVSVGGVGKSLLSLPMSLEMAFMADDLIELIVENSYNV